MKNKPTIQDRIDTLRDQIEQRYDTIDDAHDTISDLRYKISRLETENKNDEATLDRLIQQQEALHLKITAPGAIAYPGPCGSHGYLIDGYQIEVHWNAPDTPHETLGEAHVNIWDPASTLIHHRHIVSARNLPQVLSYLWDLLSLPWQHHPHCTPQQLRLLTDLITRIQKAPAA